jgi:hypothetical protein
MNIRVRASYRADTPQRLTRDELVVYGGWWKPRQTRPRRYSLLVSRQALSSAVQNLIQSAGSPIPTLISLENLTYKHTIYVSPQPQSFPDHPSLTRTDPAWAINKAQHW